MSRLLLLFAIAGLVYLLLRSYRKNLPERDRTVVDDMVQCAQCGVHLPKGDSISAEGKHFCNPAHRDAFRN